MLIPKTKIQKWLSIKAREHGFGSGYTYFINIKPDLSDYKLSEMRGCREGEEILIKVFHNKSYYSIYKIYLTVPSVEKINDVIAECSVKGTRDFQRSRCYDAERKMVQKFGQTDKLNLQECQALADEIFNSFGFDFSPKIIISKAKKATSSSYRYNRTIKLAEGWGQAKKVVLHELAHQLTYTSSVADPGHGEVYIVIMVYLYEKYLLWDRDTMLEILQRHKVKVGHEDLIGTIGKV